MRCPISADKFNNHLIFAFPSAGITDPTHQLKLHSTINPVDYSFPQVFISTTLSGSVMELPLL